MIWNGVTKLALSEVERRWSPLYSLGAFLLVTGFGADGTRQIP